MLLNLGEANNEMVQMKVSNKILGFDDVVCILPSYFKGQTIIKLLTLFVDVWA